MKHKLKSCLFMTLLILIVGCVSHEKISSTHVNRRFVARDDSLMILKDDGSYIWYQSPDNLNDNYYSGTYDLYRGEDAIEVVAKQYPDLGITVEEQRTILYNSHADDDHYYALIQHRQIRKVAGEETENAMDIVYVGIYDSNRKVWEALNCTSGTDAVFTLQNED